MPSKHAYLIIAHGQFKQLSFLVSLLDHPRNDIYIHIDAKSKITEQDIEHIQESARFSKIQFTERVSVYWGGYSQIESEMRLFKAASKGNYQSYHLLSGIDLPIVSQSKIHNFFDKYKEYAFLTMMSMSGDNEDINRFKYYHYFEKFTYRTLPGVIGKLSFKLYRYGEVFIQKLLGIDNFCKYDIAPVKASNWVSLPDNIVQLIVSREDWIYDTFHHSFLCDELFIPMLLDKEGLLDKVYDLSVNYGTKDEFQGNLRYINWWDGKPYLWTDDIQDLEQLRHASNNGYFFSRKFDLEQFPATKQFILELTKEE